ncbi:hypothetical protein V5799_004233 [Amblyomma americanum]|uniref:Uncharacterized protein n=1 Tax=Amblyomma americanum TaxID=6943 RepID=A0AAQ4D6P6_AMBAM
MAPPLKLRHRPSFFLKPRHARRPAHAPTFESEPDPQRPVADGIRGPPEQTTRWHHRDRTACSSTPEFASTLLIQNQPLCPYNHQLELFTKSDHLQRNSATLSDEEMFKGSECSTQLDIVMAFQE